jgi:hypothetical protein
MPLLTDLQSLVTNLLNYILAQRNKIEQLDAINMDEYSLIY